MLDDSLQPFGDDGIDGDIQRKLRRKCDAQLRRFCVTVLNECGIRIADIGAGHRLECEQCIRDVASDRCDHGYVKEWLGEPRAIWNGTVGWLEADNTDMGRRAPARATGVGADCQRYQAGSDSRCRATRRATGCQFRIERMSCWPEQQ